MSPHLFRALRQYHKIPQCELAREIGVSKSALCQFEKGRENAVAPWRVLPVGDEMLERYDRKMRVG